MTSFFPRLSKSSEGKRTVRPHGLAQGGLAPFRGHGHPSPYESPRKSCSPHKESMFWNLRFCSNTDPGSQSHAHQEKLPVPGLACDKRGKCCYSAGVGGSRRGGGGSRRGGGVLTYRLAPWGVVPGLSLLCHTGRESQRTIGFLHHGSQLSLNYSNVLDQLFRTMNWRVRCGFASKQED